MASPAEDPLLEADGSTSFQDFQDTVNALVDEEEKEANEAEEAAEEVDMDEPVPV
jgi:hypothetical protein